jgi:hypothetical protein
MSAVSLDCLDMTSPREDAATLGLPSMLNTEVYAVEPDRNMRRGLRLTPPPFLSGARIRRVVAGR